MGERKKTAVVTGGAGGIGKSVAKRLIEDGFRVVLVDRNGESAKAAAEELGCDYTQFDITAVNDAPAVFQGIYEKYGSVDVLINNAGISTHRGPTDTIAESDWDKIIGVNLKALFFMAKAAAPFMAKSGGGSIVNTSSMRAFLATGDRTLYAITKKAILSVDAELAADFWRYNIRVNSVSPPYVLTDMTRVHLTEPGWYENQLETLLTKDMMLPEDIAEVASFLASDESVAISGTDISCTGGTVPCRGKLKDGGV